MANSSVMRSLCFFLFLLPYGSIAFTTLLAGSNQRVTPIRRQQSWQPASSIFVTWQYLNVGVTVKPAAAPLMTNHPPNAQGQRRSALFEASFRQTKSPHGAGISRFKLWARSFRRVLKTLLLTTFLAFSLQSSAAWAVSAGRAGGSFGQSSSSRSSSPSSSSIRRAPSTRVYHHHHYSPGPAIRVYPTWPRWGYSPTRVYSSVTYDTPARGFSASDVVLLTGTGVLLAYGFSKNRDNSDVNTSALGPGVSVATITLALDVPNRDDPSNILAKLKRIAEAADTGTRRGVQTLVSNGTYDTVQTKV